MLKQRDSIDDDDVPSSREVIGLAELASVGFNILYIYSKFEIKIRLLYYIMIRKILETLNKEDKTYMNNVEKLNEETVNCCDKYVIYIIYIYIHTCIISNYLTL